MSLLSIPAIAALARRRVRQHGPLSEQQLTTWLTELDVPPDRAAAGVNLAVLGQRLHRQPGQPGHPATLTCRGPEQDAA